MKTLKIPILAIAYILLGLAALGVVWVWVWCLIVTYDYWGLLGILIGVVLAGVGVIGTATLAMLFHGNWDGLFQLFVNGVILMAMFWGGAGLMALAAYIDERVESV